MTAKRDRERDKLGENEITGLQLVTKIDNSNFGFHCDLAGKRKLNLSHFVWETLQVYF